MYHLGSDVLYPTPRHYPLPDKRPAIRLTGGWPWKLIGLHVFTFFTASDPCVRRATPRVENVVITYLPLRPNPPAVQFFILLCTYPVNDDGLPIRDSEGRGFNSFS